MNLSDLIQKIVKHNLDDALYEVAIICESQLSSLAMARLLDLDKEVDEIVFEELQPDTYEALSVKMPQLCEGCED